MVAVTMEFLQHRDRRNSDVHHLFVPQLSSDVVQIRRQQLKDLTKRVVRKNHLHQNASNPSKLTSSFWKNFCIAVSSWS